MHIALVLRALSDLGAALDRAVAAGLLPVALFILFNGLDDLVIDAAGVSASLKTALDIVRPAGQITKVGWGAQPLNFSLDPLVQKAVTLQGSYSHNWPIWEKVISLLASGKINLDLLPNRVAPLNQWQETFEEMHSGQIVKGVLKP